MNCCDLFEEPQLYTAFRAHPEGMQVVSRKSSFWGKQYPGTSRACALPPHPLDMYITAIFGQKASTL